MRRTGALQLEGLFTADYRGSAPSSRHPVRVQRCDGCRKAVAAPDPGIGGGFLCASCIGRITGRPMVEQLETK